MDNFTTWFREQGGELDASAMGFAIFPDSGRGAIALRDIPEGHALFSIPRGLTLSLRTSSLPTRFGIEAWKQHGLHEGWVGLILCMMWEESLGGSSKWSEYMSSMPDTFTTPMFWSEEEIQELKGTAVVDKIGRDDAERDYYEKLIPAIKSRPDLFLEGSIPKFYALERYHMMGSRILSRSFHVEPWRGDDGHESDESETHGDAPHSDDPNGMDVDADNPSGDTTADSIEPPHEEEVSQLDSAFDGNTDDDEDAETPADVAMVPMADMLNARFESENAKLFYEEHYLKMVATKPINAGEQIWNTYGDPPNSDLLRRYGHVDVVPLGEPLSGEGNPADVVEIRADLVVSAVRKARKAAGDLQVRVDFWLEEADDDTFVLMTDCEVPEELLSFIRLLSLTKDEWNKVKAKGKLPKGKLELELLPAIVDVLKERLKEYPTTIEEDESLLGPDSAVNLSFNKRNAVVVRLGEKRILRGALQKVEALLATQKGKSGKDKKRTRENEADGRGKKAKR
ncbi:hypothetical protein CERSUDRAFT_56467 [Gelatoporia subvermispora B]|uniref:Ribosomal lysine N-methyltransferase 4 n=1 Tax=Ceriporiopsis subvermispora (strain B) TaxID=914234 RepID=M2Q9X2_CERS8|nr:hypothetical protein CERSUDRAFT_56467 [Gelatoporia subvermispora B]